MLTRTTHPAAPGTRGFTLMEVMAALVIVAVVLLSILAIRSRNLQDAARARDTRFAGILAQRLLEEALLGLEPIEDDLPAGFSTSVSNVAETLGEEQQVVQVIVEVTFPGAKGTETLILTSYRLPLEGEEFVEGGDGG